MRVAINGFGRIGRAFFKLAQRHKDIEIVAINDLAERSDLEYLLQHDSVYGHFVADTQSIRFFQEKDPRRLPWGDLSIDVVVESTGFFRSKEKARAHIDAGARRVVISAPSDDVPTVLMGANEEELHKHAITCNASCTTNAANPVIGIIHENKGVEEALLTTVHSYTATQSLIDRVNKKDPRRGRAAAINIIPTTTGAARATGRVYSDLSEVFDGIAVRVPTPAGSLADITMLLKEKTNHVEINSLLRKSAAHPRWKDIFAVTDEPLVSSDIVGRPKASIADLSMTRVTGRLVKVLAWYDNEVGYASSLLRHVVSAGTRRPTTD